MTLVYRTFLTIIIFDDACLQHFLNNLILYVTCSQ